MRDFIVRLAGMKLAEMKFDVEVIIYEGGEILTNNLYPGSSLKEIKELIKINFINEDLRDLNRDLSISQGSICHVIWQEIWREHAEIEIVIDKPKSMSLDLFRKIMGSAGLDDKRKVAQLVKGRKK